MSAKSQGRKSAPAGNIVDTPVVLGSRAGRLRRRGNLSSETLSRGGIKSDIYELTVPPGEVPGEAEMREILVSDVRELIVPSEYAEPEPPENVEAALRAATGVPEPITSSEKAPQESYENIEAALRAAAEKNPRTR